MEKFLFVPVDISQDKRYLNKGAWPWKILKPEFHFHNSEVVHNAAQKETTTMIPQFKTLNFSYFSQKGSIPLGIKVQLLEA